MPLELPHKLPRIRIELVDNLIIATGEDGAGVVAELDARKPAIPARELLDALRRGQVPEFGDAVAAGGDDEVAAELDRVDRPAVAEEGFEVRAALPVPDADGRVLGAGDDVLVVQAYV